MTVANAEMHGADLLLHSWEHTNDVKAVAAAFEVLLALLADSHQLHIHSQLLQLRIPCLCL